MWGVDRLPGAGGAGQGATGCTATAHVLVGASTGALAGFLLATALGWPEMPATLVGALVGAIGMLATGC